MIHRWNTPPCRIAGIYFVVGAVYIVLSDWVVEAEGWTNWLPGFQTFKGLAFVFLSAILIYLLADRELRRRQKVEQQLMRAQRMEAVGQLTNGVAHDFNNFLTVIFGNLELIHQDAETNSVLRRQVDSALLAAERGADLTRRLLAFSRGQSLEPRNIDVAECLMQMKMLLDCVLGEGITVKESLTPDLPTILADPGQLESVLLNLGLNSRDAMPVGGTILLSGKIVRLDADLSQGKWRVAKGDYVKITVRDDGCGMSQQVQDRLLEPFFSTKPAGEGTGLGFPTVYKFVKQSGGYVMVQSKVGRGTSVALYFPFVEAGERAVSHHFDTTGDRQGNETVILVENDVAVREVLNTLLTRLGYRVLLASCAQEARELLSGADHVDLLLSDVVLGGDQDGISLASEVCQDHPSLPVLLISGVADPEGSRANLIPARVGWLDKPFNRKQVSQRLRDLLDA